MAALDPSLAATPAPSRLLPPLSASAPQSEERGVHPLDRGDRPLLPGGAGRRQGARHVVPAQPFAMVGVVRERFLLTYRVDPRAVRALAPEPFEPVVRDGAAFAGV